MKKFLLLLCILFAAPLARAQEISVVETRAAESVPFAQPFALQFVLSHTPGYQVTVQEESLSPQFEITQVSSADNSPGTVTYDFTALPFALGKTTFTVTFELSQDGKPLAQTKQEVFINVPRAQTFDDPNLREIRPPHIPSGWLAWLVALLLLGALVYVWRYWYKRLHERARTIRLEQDTRPGNVIALSKIDALLDSGLWENQQYKLFYIALSDILREYLWRQFHIDASADTTAELLRRVKNMPQMAQLMYQLRDFLSSGDLVKFAKAVPSQQIRDKDVQLLREIIIETSPKELAPEAPKEGV
ncbi:hypothetical protein [Candidatus Avelusimicrobium gallicola]|uniref:Protein BatD n=1 Tax=Candidatus Avelusimicrobium gallicola TaxID=2562704 RepID=A0A1Y4DDW1_9BACT|nr:hypothetical protein [Elusimicrobium sp. An273]OUO57287.1 hypothetical protein B5F75_00470 [Elusimicrobium sp. An273]